MLTGSTGVRDGARGGRWRHDSWWFRDWWCAMVIWGRLKGVGMLVVPWCTTGRGESGDTRGFWGLLGWRHGGRELRMSGGEMGMGSRESAVKARGDPRWLAFEVVTVVGVRPWWRSRGDSRRLTGGFEKEDDVGLRAADGAIKMTAKGKEKGSWRMKERCGVGCREREIERGRGGRGEGVRVVDGERGWECEGK
ncbi:unnamed protein product [Sphenostylis stenocarpa]|uniref:Uncharacterized protein n=1 Tax=Sphenostylis stenocarpa TaxID=92480 RepID=A0AA86S9R1_9FABA|nr:unnamed protein product [Sphenostylis stenocarpa]